MRKMKGMLSPPPLYERSRGSSTVRNVFLRSHRQIDPPIWTACSCAIHLDPLVVSTESYSNARRDKFQRQHQTAKDLIALGLPDNYPLSRALSLCNCTVDE